MSNLGVRRRILAGVAALLVVGLGVFGLSVSLATPAVANGEPTIFDSDGDSVFVSDAACEIEPGTPTPCVSYVGGVLELAYISSLRIASITAANDLTIHVYGDTNTVERSTPGTAIGVGGSLTVLGKTPGAKLMVGAPSGSAAVEIGDSPATLTVGAVTDDPTPAALYPVTLQITGGSYPPAPARATVNPGSTYPGGGGPGPGPGPGAAVSINGVPVDPTPDCDIAGPGQPAESEFCLQETGDPARYTLVLNSVNIDSIMSAQGLTIYLIGDSFIDAVNSDGIVSAGDVTILGDDEATLSVGTALETMDAIRFMPPPGGEPTPVLTIGDGANSVLVTIIAGMSIPVADVVRPGPTLSYYFYTPGPGPGPIGGPAMLRIGAVTLIDAGELTGDTVPGVSVENVVIPPMVRFWSVTFDGAAGQFDPVFLSGSDGFHFSAASANPVRFAADDVDIDEEGPDTASGLSIDARGENSSIVFIGGDAFQNTFQLDGGIATNDTVRLDGGVSVTIGGPGVPAPTGLEIGFDLALYSPGRSAVGAELEVYTATGVPGITAAPNTNPRISVQSKASLLVYAGGDATQGFQSNDVSVANGGMLFFNYDPSSALGIDHAVSLLWPEQPVGCITEAEPREPYRWPADEYGAHPQRGYTLSGSPEAGRYLLTSTAPGLVNLSWEQGVDAREPVTGGQVCVEAARGQVQIDQGVYYSFMIEEGSEVTIKLLPEHENQFVSGEFSYEGPDVDGGEERLFDVGGPALPNSVPLNPLAAQAAEYTFTMPAGNISLSTVFEPVADGPADVTGTDIVQSATFEVPAAEINGNASLEISDVVTPQNASEFAEAAGSRTIANYLDISLQQQIQQGNTGEVWVEDITELLRPATVSVVLDPALRGFSNYVVLHDDGESVTAIPAVFDPATGTLTFETDGFSTYAIAHGAAVFNPNTYDPGVAQWVYLAWASGLALVMMLGGALLWRRLSTR